MNTRHRMIATTVAGLMAAGSAQAQTAPLAAPLKALGQVALDALDGGARALACIALEAICLSECLQRERRHRDAGRALARLHVGGGDVLADEERSIRRLHALEIREPAFDRLTRLCVVGLRGRDVGCARGRSVFA